MSLSREELRGRVLGYKTTGLKRDKIDTPWIPECAVTLDVQGNVVEDTRLEVREMMADESLQFDKEAKVDNKRAIGRMIARCLLMPGTSTPVMNETDLDAIMSELGLSTILPIMEHIKVLSGSADTAKEDAKKNSQTTPPSDSTTN
jgi:hypothetical protein